MKSRTISMVLALIATSSVSLPCHADDHGAAGNAAPIKGADVMGDKNRSGPDGWVQAPVSRDEAPATTQKAAGETEKPLVAAKPQASTPMKPGDDPGTPIEHPASGPGRNAATPN